MNVALGADHRGVRHKEWIKQWLEAHGHQVVDFGAEDETESRDYPDFAFPVARAVAEGRCERGVLVCGSGIGMSMAANRVRGVRAALCVDRRMAEASRRHNNANVLCIGQDMTDAEATDAIVDTWFSTPFEGGRHERRVSKLDS